MSSGTDRLACASCHLGPRAWIWAEDRELGLAGLSVVLPGKGCGELSPRAHVGLLRREVGPRLGTLALEILLKHGETKARTEFFEQTFLEQALVQGAVGCGMQGTLG